MRKPACKRPIRDVSQVNETVSPTPDVMDGQPKIWVIVSDHRVPAQVEAVRGQLAMPIKVVFSDASRCMDVAQEAAAAGVMALVSRGSIAHSIRTSDVSLPVIEIPLSGLDILELLDKARTVSRRIAIVAFDNLIEGARSIAPILGVELVTYRLSGPDDAERGVRHVYDEGLRVLIGGGKAVDHAQALGMRAFLIRSRTEGVLQAIREAERMVHAIENERVTTARREVMLDSIPEAIISLDADGAVIHHNRLAARLFSRHDTPSEGLNPDFIEGIGLAEAARGGKRWSGEIRQYGAVQYACTLNPVFSGPMNCGGVAIIQEVAHLQKLEQKVRKSLYNNGHVARYRLEDVIHSSPATRQLVERARNYASSPSTILIQGESGTGKEIFAQSIHRESLCSEGPFVAINCTALPENLLESELFGYGEGAFTGARKGGKPGLFEIAHKGTLFLDEIGEIPVSVQARLLRVLEEKSVMRIGQESKIPVDVRIICATNRDLEKMVTQGSFREDLYYRLNVLRLELLPLRERPEDISVLIEHFLGTLPGALGLPRPRLSEEAREVLLHYHYPGNIRELRNMMERLVVISRGGLVARAEALTLLRGPARLAALGMGQTPPRRREAAPDKVRGIGLLREEEFATILRTLSETGGNKAETARRLGISPSTLWRRLAEWKDLNPSGE